MIIKKRYRPKILKTLINIDDFALTDYYDCNHFIFYQTRSVDCYLTFHIKILNKDRYFNYFPKKKILINHVTLPFFHSILVKSGFEKIVRNKLRELVGC